MDYINEFPIRTINRESGVEFESTGDKLRGPNGLKIINHDVKEIKNKTINYIDLEKANFLKAIINGKGDMWENNIWSKYKGQSVLGDYVDNGTYITPNTEALFKADINLNKATIILETTSSADSRVIITHYDSNFTQKISNTSYITIDGDIVKVTDINIYKIKIIPEIIPEEWAEIMLNKTLIAQPYFTFNGSKFVGQITGAESEALGRGETLDFSYKEINL